MLRVVVATLRSPLSLAAGVVAGAGVFLLIVWLPNLGLIWDVVTGGSMSFSQTAGFLWDSLGALHTNFTSVGATLTIAVAMLFGLNVAVAVRYVRDRAAEVRAGGGGAALGGGMLVALAGAGCSSCGAVVLSTLFGAGATGSFIAGLPLRGEEFSILSVLALAVTLVVTARKASGPGACRIASAASARDGTAAGVSTR